MQKKIFSINNSRGGNINHLEPTFQGYMSSPRQNKRGDIDQIMRFIPSLVSHKKNKLLMKAISLVEVEEAIF